MAKEAKDPIAEQWISTIGTYDREFKRWTGRVEKIIKKYRDEVRYSTQDSGARFNILWSNIQTAIPAVFSRLPQPDVSRRFKDNDPVGRVAALILERALEFEINHYPDYRASMNECVLDRFLGGRGTTWLRYEPHTRAAELDEPEDGKEVTEDADEAEDEALEEELIYECAPCDYVHWKDFGHTIARTWEEVTGVWRKVYMGREALVERFGDLGKTIPLDTKPDKDNRTYGTESQDYEALIFEIWDKKTGCVYWISKSLGKVLDTLSIGDKRLPKLENFWPCPKPLYATLTTDSLIPVPDFTLYQDQANTLDVLADRIHGLCKMLQVKGVYDASVPELARIFTEGQNGALYAVKNWNAFAEKQGLKSAIEVADLTPIYEALKAAYEAVTQQKGIIYEITGLADIIRGQSDPNETATAVKEKGNWGSLRLRSMQADVACFATEILQIKAQIMCDQFQPQTLAAIGGAQTLSDEDKQYIGPALQLLKSGDLRDFRIEIVADSLVYMDELQEKQDRTEFITAMGNFLKQAVPAAQQSPEMGPLLCEMLKFAAQAYKVGKAIEGAFDQLADKLKQIADNPPPKQDPEMAKVQAQTQLEQQKMSNEQQMAQFKANLDAQVAQAQQAAQAQQEQQQEQLEAQRAQQEASLKAQVEQHKATLDAQNRIQELAFERWKAELDAKTRIAVAEITARWALQRAQLQAATAEAQGGAMPADQPQPQGAPNAPVSG